MRALLPYLATFSVPLVFTSAPALASPFGIFEALHLSVECATLAQSLAICDEQSAGNQVKAVVASDGYLSVHLRKLEKAGYLNAT